MKARPTRATATLKLLKALQRTRPGKFSGPKLNEHLIRRAAIAAAPLAAEICTHSHADGLNNPRDVTDGRHDGVLHLLRRFLHAVQGMGHHLIDADHL